MPKGTKGKGGGHRVKDGKERDIRDSMMLAQVILGRPRAEIAEMFNCHTDTVGDALARARSKNLYGIVEAVMTENLIPKAILVYDEALDKGNVKVAGDILHGVGILKSTQVTTPVGPSEVTIEMLRARMREQKALKALGDSSSNVTVEITKIPVQEGQEVSSEGIREGLDKGASDESDSGLGERLGGIYNPDNQGRDGISGDSGSEARDSSGGSEDGTDSNRGDDDEARSDVAGEPA